jgi:hypothetical protein
MRKLLYGLLVTAMFTIGSCTLPKMVKMAKDQDLKVDPNPLEVHKDTVAYTMTANLPVKMLKKGTAYTVNSFYKYGDSEIALEPVSPLLSKLRTSLLLQQSNLRQRSSSASLTSLNTKLAYCR